MSSLLIILAIVCAVVGIIGAVVPGLPGPPISWATFLCLYFAGGAFASQVSVPLLVIMGVLAVLITILDYVVPAWGTKRFGGTKAGTRGSTIGLIIVVFVVPIFNLILSLMVTVTGLGIFNIFIIPSGLLLILAGPFVGAYIGEKTQHVSDSQALRSAFGSFVGFLAGTFIKVVYGLVVIIWALVIICKGVF